MVLPSELASIASAVSELTATVSLIYVGNSDSAEHAPYKGVDPAGNHRSNHKHPVGADQFHNQCGIAMIAMEDYFSQHERGLLSTEHFSRGSETSRNRLKEPGLRAYWIKQREILAGAAPTYCAYIDSLCTEETTPFSKLT
jgi:hypothetical protein